VDVVKEEPNERCESRDGYEMIESHHTTTELIAFHKRKRKFLNLKNLATEDPDQLVMCEFNGQNFDLVAD
jgi:hypothetical protein